MARRVGLRTEIIVNLVLLMGAAMVFSGLLLIRFSESELLSQRIRTARQTVLVAGRGIEQLAGGRDLANVGTDRLHGYFSGLSGDAGIEQWWLVDRRLLPVASTAARGGSDPGNSPPVFPDSIRHLDTPLVEVRYPLRWFPFQQPAEESDLTVSVPLRDDGRFLGALQVRLPLHSLRERMEGTQRIFFAFVFLCGVVLVLFGVFFLGRTVVRPIRRLLRATREVGGGNLEESVPVQGPAEIADLAGAFNGMIGELRESRQETARYIRSLEQTNAALSDSRRELLRSERMASVGHLAAGMAHEVGNPLGAMVGYLELLKSDLRSAEQADLVERTLAEAGRIDHLVRDLLDFAAPAKGAGESAEPAVVMRDAHAFLSRQGKFDRLQAVVDLPDALPRVALDADRLLQVLVNLLLNACDATPEGGEIRLRGRRTPTGVRLEVADSGAGMDEELQAQVFDPFFSTKAEGRGRGLGLTICHRIVEEANGRIEVDSAAGRGTTFSITLPSVEEG